MAQAAVATTEGDLRPSPSPRNDVRALRILARSLIKELRRHGHDNRSVVVLATELLDQLSQEIHSKR